MERPDRVRADERHLSEAAIREIATPESFRRGREYFEDGAVVGLTRRGDQIEAEVAGSQYLPYQVRVTLGGGAVREASCSCPYAYGGACKHVVAALLAYCQRPETVEERPPLEALLADLDADQLRRLIARLAASQPGLVELVELAVEAERASAASGGGPAAGYPRAGAAPVDAKAVRRQVAAALGGVDWRRGSEAYYQVPAVAAEVRRIADQAQPYLAAGDGRAALGILEAVAEEYLAGWEILDDSDGDASALFYDLDRRFAEAILSADLSADERRAWADRFADWARQVGDYGVDDAFYAAEQAAVEGWDDERVRAALRGEPVERDAEGDLPWSDELVAARLDVLARRGSTQEYLDFARATGQHVRYAAMLVSLGRTDEAVEHGLKHLETPDEVLELARTFQERGVVAEALRLAEHGLGLEEKWEGEQAALAGWLRDLASAADRPDVARHAARTALDAHPTLANYQALEMLAGEDWPTVRDEVLARLRRSRSFEIANRVDIFLHEGLIDDAIAAVERPDAYADYATLERVVEAAIPSHPDWVMRTCRRQAEAIAVGGYAQHYDRAARWLRHAGAAAAAAGRIGEWRADVEGLIEEHRRKYKLVPLLRALLTAHGPDREPDRERR